MIKFKIQIMAMVISKYLNIVRIKVQICVRFLVRVSGRHG
jgi:hypothetical protein